MCRRKPISSIFSRRNGSLNFQNTADLLESDRNTVPCSFLFKMDRFVGVSAQKLQIIQESEKKYISNKLELSNWCNGQRYGRSRATGCGGPLAREISIVGVDCCPTVSLLSDVTPLSPRELGEIEYSTTIRCYQCRSQPQDKKARDIRC